MQSGNTLTRDVTLHLGYDTIGGTGEMMGRLKHVWDLFRNRNGEDEEVTGPEVEGLVKLLHGGLLEVPPFGDGQ